MKLTQFMAYFATMLRVPLAELAQLLLMLRQGCSKLALEERRLAQAARKAGYRPFDWDGRTFANLLQGESGRYGGVTCTPTVCALFLTAFLVDSTRAAVAAKALRIFYAPATVHWRGWRETATWPPVREPETEVKICPRTGERFFGGALIKMLADRALLDVDEIHVSTDRDFAVLEFVDGSETRFSFSPLDKTSSYSMCNLPAFAIKPLADMIREEESSAA